jgi:predicted nucleic acid-binding Zn ribbon protein
VVPAGSHPALGLHAVVVACRSCGRWLVVHPQVANLRHCSPRCFRFDRSARERERRRQTRTLGFSPHQRCWHCGAAFDPKRSDARYCSGRCRTAASRAR